MDLTLIPFFVLFSFWWWALFIAASSLLFWALEYENIGAATFVFLVTLFLMTAFGGSEILNFLLTGWNFVLVIASYLLMGVLWGFVKWWLFVTQKLTNYEDVKIQWLEERDIKGKTVPDNFKTQWENYLLKTSQFTGYKNGKQVLKIQPVASEYKLKIVNWMAYWPWSLIWTLFSDVIKRIFIRIQRWCSQLMNGISNWVFRNIHKDFQ